MKVKVKLKVKVEGQSDENQIEEKKTNNSEDGNVILLTMVRIMAKRG